MTGLQPDESTAVDQAVDQVSGQTVDQGSGVSLAGPLAEQRSTIRYRIVLVSVLAAFILYLDRICISEIVKSVSFQEDMQLTEVQVGQVFAAFFFSYALFQVPAGWLSDRFGARRMMSLYILSWSLLTVLTGFMTTLTGLILVRLGFGLAQAGAYPTMSATLRRWIRIARRGQASSFVSLGGRLGGTLAPFITVLLLGLWMKWNPALWLSGMFGWEVHLPAGWEWRLTLWIYGGISIVIAIAYWWVIRDSPAEHPRCNELERVHIGSVSHEKRPGFGDIVTMLAACCTNRSLWLNSLAQFSINFGWAFLILWLTKYLTAVKNVPNAQAALMVTLVLATGIVGQPLGGLATDWCVKRFGLRRGRVMTIMLASTIAACSYLSCLVIDSVWGVVACCMIVSLMTDIGNPSIWAFMQDIGGKNTGAIFGWANMWGNFGATLNSFTLPYLLMWGMDNNWGYAPVFIACAVAFLVAGAAASGMDATRPLLGGDR